MRRGEVYLADLGEAIGHEQAFRRPVLVVSAQPWLESNPPVVAVLPLTRTHRGRSTHVEVEPGASGLKATSYVKCENLRAVSPVRLGIRFGHADATVLFKVDTILRRLLAL
ncbi:MAG: type II toxin-antitoxin system PemK/MazF family toxin [Propionibacteriaceae bacterium]|nr:type II toxin-antitoxin system PemK/MazF family toxin [Propionibacteriaceae bacterium]